MNTLVRTRFAPSPTGYLHVGGIRTALFAHLLARQHGGQFVLRLEDTDKKREVPGSREHLMLSLRSLDLAYDEGPDIGGPYTPYTQSERLSSYKEWAQKLIDSGRAYADPYTSEEIQSFRDQATAEKRAFLYRHHRPENPPVWDGSQPLRFKSDPKQYKWQDAVMGEMTTGPEVVDDFILIKSDGFPTYNFAHIVDDMEMKITHIIRGQEFLSSMPNYLNLYEALSIDRPVFVHVPHILNEQGNKKLGKRDGAKDVLEYLKDGYLAETMLSFIATLGWNDGTEQEVFTHDELIEKFSLDHIQRSGARFDEKRLLWMNGQFIRSLTVDELYERLTSPDDGTDFWPEAAKNASEAYKRQVLALAQDRLKTLQDLREFNYFFECPIEDKTLITDNKQLKKLEPEEIEKLMDAAKTKFENIVDWSPAPIQSALNELLEETGQKPGILFSLIRIYVSWAPFSPQLNDTLALLGRDNTLARLAISK